MSLVISDGLRLSVRLRMSLGRLKLRIVVRELLLVLLMQLLLLLLELDLELHRRRHGQHDVWSLHRMACPIELSVRGEELRWRWRS